MSLDALRMSNVAKVVVFNISSRTIGVEMVIRCCFVRSEIENPGINPRINLKINPRIYYNKIYVYIPSISRTFLHGNRRLQMLALRKIQSLL